MKGIFAIFYHADFVKVLGFVVTNFITHFAGAERV